MTAWLDSFLAVLRTTVVDVVPIALVLFGFQYLVLRRPVPRLPKVALGFVLVVIGMVFFLEGLEQALFPLGRLMARSLSSPEFLGLSAPSTAWEDYLWVYLFAAALGFATTIAEPALIAVAMEASRITGGAIRPWGLRLVQTAYAPKAIIALAYDTGGVTTSTVTVPLVAALGLGLAAQIPGRSPVLDGFGLIAFGSLFPMMTVMGYAQAGEWLAHRRRRLKNPS